MRTRHGAVAWLLSVCGALLCDGAHPQRRSASHISSTGDDARGDGSAARPWRTYARARRAGPGRSLHFGPGVHSVGAGLLLGEADSGSVVSGAGAGVTVLTGGAPLPAWTVTRDAATGLQLWTAPLAAPNSSGGAGLLHTQLFIQEGGGGGGGGEGGGDPFRFGRRLTARSPVMAYDHSSEVDPKHSIVFRPGQVQARYR